MMIIGTLPTKDKIHRYQRCLVVPFAGKRKVMSTSMHNGGYREDLTAVFNHDVNPGPGVTCSYCTQGEEEHQKFIRENLGLDYDTVAYMATIVSMDNAVVREATYDELTVTAIVTASVEVNGGRVGEPATCHEKHGKSIRLQPGTINMMVFVNADLTPGCLARAMITATEAKTAALQELMAASLNSSGLATGTGTDNMMIIANAESDHLLTYAGKSGKLGELIGVTVMAAVKQSLGQHMNLTVERQHSMLARMKRFGIGENSFSPVSPETGETAQPCRADFLHTVHMLDQCDQIVTFASLYAHLLDQLDWQLLSVKEAAAAGEDLLLQLATAYGCPWQKKKSTAKSIDEGKDQMLRRFIDLISALALSKYNFLEEKK